MKKILLVLLMVPLALLSGCGGGDDDPPPAGDTNIAVLNVEANGDPETTSELTIEFDKVVPGLTAADFTVTGTGANANVVRGALSGTGPIYTLGVSNILGEEDLALLISKPGYNFILPTWENIEVFLDQRVQRTFTVTQDGNATNTTTTLTFTFDDDIVLTAADITVTGTGFLAGVTKGTLTGDDDEWTLALTGIVANGTLTVSVKHDDFNITNGPTEVNVFYHNPSATTVSFSVTVNGAGGVGETESITLTFDPGLGSSTFTAANNILLTSADGAEHDPMGMFTNDSGDDTYTLEMEVSKSGTLTVAVNHPAFIFNPASVDVNIVAPVLVTFNSVTVNNGGATNTTQSLTLSFSQAISGLTADDIILTQDIVMPARVPTANASGAAAHWPEMYAVSGAYAIVEKGTLSGSGPSYTLALTVEGGGKLDVSVVKPGFKFDKTQEVYVYGNYLEFKPPYLRFWPWGGETATPNGTDATYDSTEEAFWFGGNFQTGSMLGGLISAWSSGELFNNWILRDPSDVTYSNRFSLEIKVDNAALLEHITNFNVDFYWDGLGQSGQISAVNASQAMTALAENITADNGEYVTLEYNTAISPLSGVNKVDIIFINFATASTTAVNTGRVYLRNFRFYRN